MRWKNRKQRKASEMSKISEYFIALYWPDDKLAKALPDLSPLKDGVFELAIRSNRDKGRKILNMARCNLSQPRECLERLNQCYLVLYGLSGIRVWFSDNDFFDRIEILL
jgi:hypothetical protein